jgi:hypothetical protein
MPAAVNRPSSQVVTFLFVPIYPAFPIGCQELVRRLHFAGKVNSVSPAIAPQQLGHGTPTEVFSLGHERTHAPQQDTHSADRFTGARQRHRECRTLLFDSNCAELHSDNFVNDITYPVGDRM